MIANRHTQNARRLRRAAIDTSVPLKNCRAKSDRIDLGLAIMCAVREAGAEFTQQEIALFCGCTRAMIGFIEQRAMAKVENSLRTGAHNQLWKELTR